MFMYTYSYCPDWFPRQVGDDLRQDILVLQMVQLMEKIWLRAGLDLRMVTYCCMATGPDQGRLDHMTTP